MSIRIGTQDYQHGRWVGRFYPAGTSPGEMLAIYAESFTTVEIGSSAFHFPPDPVVRHWIESVGPEFRFSVQSPLTITHERRFVDTGALVAKLARRLEPLGERLGAVLFKVPPNFLPTDVNRRILEEFLDSLPRGMRAAVEFRSDSWLEGSTFELLANREVAVALTAGRWLSRDGIRKIALTPTASFSYVRWTDPPPADRFAEEEFDPDRTRWGSVLAEWAEMLEKMRQSVDTIYGYFSDRFEGHGPASAREFLGLMDRTIGASFGALPRSADRR